MLTSFRQQGLIALALIALIVTTRGSHAGTSFSLPDATLPAMLLGGILLRRKAWFAVFLAVCAAVDAFAVGVAGVSSYCLTPAYWALLPTYAVMWLGGHWLVRHEKALQALPYAAVALFTTIIAFVISTYSFYLLSGRFPHASLWEVLQHGWEYFPAYLGYTMMYLGLGWVALRTYAMARSLRNSHPA